MVYPVYEIPPMAAGMAMTLINAVESLLPREEYESAVILGRSLKGILKAGDKEWWRDFPVVYRGKTERLRWAGCQTLFDVVIRSVGEIPKWLEDDLEEIRDYLREVGFRAKTGSR